MKKLICALMCAGMALSLTACSGEKQESSVKEEVATEWTRSGYFEDENENMLTVTYMEDIDEPGWYVGFMLGENSWGGVLPQEGNSLHGELTSIDEIDPITVTVTEEGEDGLILALDGGETYHFTVMDMPEATIFININTEGEGNIAYETGETTPEIDTEYPFQSAVINLAEPETYTFVAWAPAGSLFVKWTKNGEDFSTDEQITVLLDESAEYVAVFEADPDWQNPVMNFIGEYQCDRAHATVDAFEGEDALIIIDWAGSASEVAQWDIYGKMDMETMTVTYKDVVKSIIVYDESGEVISQEPEYEDGTGTITFNNDGTFTWHDDKSETGEDMVFEWLPVDGD